MSQVINLKELYNFAKNDHELIGMNGSSGVGKKNMDVWLKK